MTPGTPKFDALQVGELSADFIRGAGNIMLKTKVAFVNTKNGATHGWSSHEGPWSPETIAKLKELAELMEQDLAKVHFEGGATTLGTTRSAPAGIGGLAEHLSPGDAPQV